MAEEEKRRTFDVTACESLRRAAVGVLADHPEVRTVGIVVDYFGDLNDASIDKLVWVGASGRPSRPDEIMGSVFQTFRLLSAQLGAGLEVAEKLRTHIQALSEELRLKHEEAEKAVPPAG